jgi:NAD(P)-dependent dehydrogenase (short-subunit alcohol dehydrogenase family)
MSAITHNNTNNLEGQRALVTGATSGIGRAVALQLARDGAEVLVHGRDAARGAETVQEITDAGGKASFVAADLADGADVQRLASDVGDVDILINNAGIALFAPTAEFDVSAFDKMFASNVRAPFFLVAAFAPGMAAKGHGSVISVSSMAGGVGLVGGAAYGATKASLEAMTRAWAAEYSASGVRVNAIAPGPVYTPSPSGPEFITALGETTPMHRASQPEEIAEVVAFLASPKASYITGTTVAADGGRRAI